MKKRLISIMAVVIVLGTALAGCTTPADTTPKNTDVTDTSAKAASGVFSATQEQLRLLPEEMLEKKMSLRV